LADDRRVSADGAMLRGQRIILRPIREADLDAFYAAHTDIANRGAFFPLGVASESKLRRDFAETGLWEREEGTLLIVTPAGEMAGHIEFFKPVGYWDAWELSYQLYDDAFAGRGYVSEAVQLMVDYLFGSKKPHRIQLVIVPENAASRRIAEKCGFTLEGTARGAFFNDGRNQDVLIYSLLRTDPRPWREPAEG
jgi:RimJ/RimL family protein N-acetyltransferase